ncbi:hypothetical protein EOL96_04520 [Candidatus Saccharibacteria bacterium]|nr:hypothetical protein [Candidatus Saccharibacteria bacterium]
MVKEVGVFVGGIERLDEKDIALRNTLATLQNIAHEQVRRLKQPIGTLPVDELQEFCDRVTVHLMFELTQALPYAIGSLVSFDGDGGIIAYNMEGEPSGVQGMEETDDVTGVLSSVSFGLAPSHAMMREHTQTGQDMPVVPEDFVPTALVVLDSPLFSANQENGNRITVALENMQAVVPVTYGMRPHVVLTH